jgi:hypothetical protein
MQPLFFRILLLACLTSNTTAELLSQQEVGAWLRKVVLRYYQYHAVPGNSTQLRIFVAQL